MQDTDQRESAALQTFEPMVEDVYSIETVVQITQTPRHQIAVYCRHGLISPVMPPEHDGWWFDLEAIRELRRLERLRVNYGMNLAGLQVISELFSEVERLREEVRTLRQS
jgi:DNA-binding transcriptional MerR regulator